MSEENPKLQTKNKVIINVFMIWATMVISFIVLLLLMSSLYRDYSIFRDNDHVPQSFYSLAFIINIGNTAFAAFLGMILAKKFAPYLQNPKSSVAPPSNSLIIFLSKVILPFIIFACTLLRIFLLRTTNGRITNVIIDLGVDFFLTLAIVIWVSIWTMTYYPAILPAVFDDALAYFDEAIIGKVKNLFDSDKFLSVLRTALPKGSESEEHGFDFIPFMLHAVDERRKRFERSSKQFLWMTIILGLFFTIILSWFAYILINEAAAGTQKNLADLAERTQELKDLSAKVRNIEIAGLINTSVKPVTQLKAEDGSEPPAISAMKAYIGSNTLSENVDPAALLKIMQENNNFEKLKGLSDASKQTYVAGTQALMGYSENKDTLLVQLPQKLNNLDNFIKTATDDLRQPEHRIPDLIKRLFLSLALATFFIAILRYLTKLYRDHYQQLILAEQDSLAIRKFYVSYKCCKDEDQRKAVLTSFMKLRGNEPAYIADADSETNISPELLKELLSAISKKL